MRDPDAIRDRAIARKRREERERLLEFIRSTHPAETP